MSPLSKPIANQEETATVTFYRTSIFGSAIQAPVAKEAHENEISAVGIVSKGYKVTQVVTPGSHTYVVGGESSSIVKGNFVSNKHYYIRVEPRMGWLKARFDLVPITADELNSESLRNDIQSCLSVELNEQGYNWFNNHYGSMKVKLIKGKKDYEEELRNGDEVYYVKPEDGVDWVLY